MGALFGNLLTWIVGFILSPIFYVLYLVGLALPSCAELGIVGWTAGTLNMIVQLIRFASPVLVIMPWSLLWNALSLLILYWSFKWIWTHLPWFSNLVVKFWPLLIIFYVILPAVTWFISNDWMEDSAFTEIFGEAPSSTGEYTGGGFGGGGGGSW